MAEAYGPGPEETMSRHERAALQQTRLRGLVDRLVAAGGVQGERLREAGVTGGADIGRIYGTPTPTGCSRCRCATSSRSTAPADRADGPTLVAYTKGDLELWAAMCARSLVCAGAGPPSVVHNAYGYGLFTGGLGIHQGAIALGAAVVPMSG